MSDEINKKIGRYLKELRLKKGIKQVDLARMLGATHVTLNHIEQGSQRVDLMRFMIICKSLGENPSINYLFEILDLENILCDSEQKIKVLDGDIWETNSGRVWVIDYLHDESIDIMLKNKSQDRVTRKELLRYIGHTSNIKIAVKLMDTTQERGDV